MGAGVSRSFPKRLWDWLGSREFSVFLFITAIIYSLISYVFSLLVSPAWFERFQQLLPLVVLYAVFFVNLLICEIKWIPVALRRCRRPEAPKSEKDLERFTKVGELSQSESDLEALAGRLRKGGYTLQEGESPDNQSAINNQQSTVLHAHRGRFSPLGNILFHLGFFLLLSGIIVSMLFRVDGRVNVVVGTTFSGELDSYDQVEVASLATLPEAKLTLNAVTTEFWENQLLFTDLRAEVIMEDGVKEYAWLSKAFKVGGANITIQGISYAPEFRLMDIDGEALHAAVQPLKVFLPGTEEMFRIPGYPHKFIFSFYPDALVKGESVSNRSMYRKNPIIGLKVYRGRLPVFSGLIREGETVEFDSLKLIFPKVRYAGDLRIIKDPGDGLIWIAFIMMAAGLAWRFFFYRKEMALVHGSSGYDVYVKSDFFPRLFALKAKGMLSEE